MIGFRWLSKLLRTWKDSTCLLARLKQEEEERIKGLEHGVRTGECAPHAITDLLADVSVNFKKGFSGTFRRVKE